MTIFSIPRRRHLMLVIVVALTVAFTVAVRGAAVTAVSRAMDGGIGDSLLRSRTGFSQNEAGSVSTSLVITQVYGGGGNSVATYRNDYIELFNVGAVPVSVDGWSVQYAPSTGSTWKKTDLSGVIPAGRFYLVQEAAGAAGTTDLPAPDAIGSITMAAGSGKVALVSNTTPLSGICPSAAVVDIVGYGSANCFETASAPFLSNTTAAARAGNPPIDTDNNHADFAAAAPFPRSSIGTPPIGSGRAAPASIAPGESLLLTVMVTPGQFPDADGIAVTADLGPLGGAAGQPLFDDGSHGDVTAGDGIHTVETATGIGVPAGPASIVATLNDDLARHSTTAITVAIEAPVSAVHTVQGPGPVSPVVGQFVTTSGVVIGVKTNGFFVQTPDDAVDTDAMTSEGLLVFTGGIPPAAAAPGNMVRVSGTVTEFVPAGDPASPPITEIGGGSTPAVSVRLLSSGHPLPDPTLLTSADTSPGGSIDQLERLEGMRVRVEALRVIAPTQAAFVDEPAAISVSNGVFYGVIDGLARPLREPGIGVLSPLPAEAPCCVPRFDGNPERLRVDSDGLFGGTRLEVNAGALLTNLVGPLDFSFRTSTILPEPDNPPLLSDLHGAIAVPIPAANELTIAGFNAERFFDTIDDPAIDDVVLSAAAFDNRITKASLAIRTVMRSPDIIGVQEMENLTTLQALAARLNADTVAAGDADPQYTAYLIEGNDIGGIDSGFLVKQLRVAVDDVLQEGAATTFIDPTDGSVDLLNDRPPLILRATVLGPPGPGLPVTLIVNHLRSLSGLEGTDGARIRAKRRAQAEYLATLIQARQEADPTERIAAIGDFNAFPFNDGHVDVVGTVQGTPAPGDQVVLASADLVEPDLTNLVDTLPVNERYSFSFDGNAQALDHVLVNGPMLARFSRLQFARNDTDFPESLRNDPGRPERISDHDMPVAYFVFDEPPGRDADRREPAHGRVP